MIEQDVEEWWVLHDEPLNRKSHSYLMSRALRISACSTGHTVEFVDTKS